MYVSSGIRGASDTAAHRIDYSEYHGTTLLRQLDGGKGIGSLAALGKGKDHVSGSYHWVAVTEFAGIGYFHGDAAEHLNELLANKGSMP